MLEEGDFSMMRSPPQHGQRARGDCDSRQLLSSLRAEFYDMTPDRNRLRYQMLEIHRQFVGAETSRQTQRMELHMKVWCCEMMQFSSLLLKGTNTGELRLAINALPSNAGAITPLTH
jgi:hypothetical protein